MRFGSPPAQTVCCRSCARSTLLPRTTSSLEPLPATAAPGAYSSAGMMGVSTSSSTSMMRWAGSDDQSGAAKALSAGRCSPGCLACSGECQRRYSAPRRPSCSSPSTPTAACSSRSPRCPQWRFSRSRRTRPQAPGIRRLRSYTSAAFRSTPLPWRWPASVLITSPA